MAVLTRHDDEIHVDCGAEFFGRAGVRGPCDGRPGGKPGDQPVRFHGEEIYPINQPSASCTRRTWRGRADGLDSGQQRAVEDQHPLQPNRQDQRPPAEEGIKKEINQLPPDARFGITSIPSEKRISSLVVADLNGDGRPDLAYYGDPKELVVLYNQGSNGWSAPKRWPISDGQMRSTRWRAGISTAAGEPV